jgi:hypothetical protein
MTCRICYEADPPLYYPCKCDGSIKWIHEECLLQWIISRTDNRNYRCELCKEIYKISYNQPLEVDIVNPPFKTFFFINPSWHIAAHSLSVILVKKAFAFLDIHLIYLITQYIYHASYLLLLGISIWKTVKDHKLYYRQFQKTSIMTVLNFHIIILTVSLVTYMDFHSKLLMLLVISSQCYLGIYPVIHSEIIQNMNKTRRLTVKNYY